VLADPFIDRQDQEGLRIVRVLHGAHDIDAVFADLDEENQP
jgi:plasmid stabilization system protein ParE